MIRSRIFPFLGLVLMLGASAQENSRGMIRIYALTESGTPIDSARVRIDGIDTERTVDVKGPTSIALPYGVYTLACIHKTLATQFKVVRVESPGPIDVVFGLPLANPGQITGEGDFTPFEISGTVAPAPAGSFGRVKAVGIFTEGTGDSTIDREGRFRLLLRDEGVYRLFVLYGKDVVHEENLDLTWAIPRGVKLDIKVKPKRINAK